MTIYPHTNCIVPFYPFLKIRDSLTRQFSERTPSIRSWRLGSTFIGCNPRMKAIRNDDAGGVCHRVCVICCCSIGSSTSQNSPEEMKSKSSINIGLIAWTWCAQILSEWHDNMHIVTPFPSPSQTIEMLHYHDELFLAENPICPVEWVQHLQKKGSRTCFGQTVI